jgi:hypothetical protein
MVRSRYVWAGRQVDVAQTFCVFSVTIAWPKPSDEAMTDFIQKVGRTLLADSLRFVPQAKDTVGDTVFGNQTPTMPPPQNPDYIDHMRWWCDGTRVGFVTLKVERTPGRAVMSWVRELNLVWFGLYAK